MQICFLNDDFTVTPNLSIDRLKQCYPSLFPTLVPGKPQLYFIEGPSRGIQIIANDGTPLDYFEWLDLSTVWIVSGNVRYDLSLTGVLLPRGLYLLEGELPEPAS